MRLAREIPKFDPVRFMSHVAKSDGCWLWTGARNHAGYGSVGLNRHNAFNASRVAYSLFVGYVPRDLFVLHHCDTPLCVKTEPDEKYPNGHLFLGTPSDNSKDCARKGRLGVQRSKNLARRNYYGNPRFAEAARALAVKKRVPVDVVARIRSLRSEDMTYKTIGALVGVSWETVRNICKGRGYYKETIA